MLYVFTNASYRGGKKTIECFPWNYYIFGPTYPFLGGGFTPSGLKFFTNPVSFLKLLDPLDCLQHNLLEYCTVSNYSAGGATRDKSRQKKYPRSKKQLTLHVMPN